MRSASLLLSLLAVVGCTAGTPDNAEDLQPPPEGQGFQYRMQSTLAAGIETERCKLFITPPDGFYINRGVVRYTPGSHHVLLFTTNYTTLPTTTKDGRPIDPNGVNECPEGASADYDITSVIGGAQTANAPDIINLPSDAGIKVPGNTVLVMNTHYLNASSKSLETDARINLYTVPPSQVKKEAGIIFFYNPIIKVPKRSSGQARMACPVNREYTIFNLQTHMHKRGLGGSAMLTDKDGNMIQQMYASSHWENPEVTTFDPGMKVQPGTLIDYRCHFQNDEDRDIYQGPTTKDEMCMLVGAYYPRNTPFEYCSPDGSAGLQGFAATFIGNGSKTCKESVDCIDQSRMTTGPEERVYDCLLNSCEKAARPLNAAVRCFFTQAESQCKTQCADLKAPDCTTCIRTACAADITTCDASTCQ
jgi:hypothetical protein